MTKKKEKEEEDDEIILICPLSMINNATDEIRFCIGSPCMFWIEDLNDASNSTCGLRRLLEFKLFNEYCLVQESEHATEFFKNLPRSDGGQGYA